MPTESETGYVPRKMLPARPGLRRRRRDVLVRLRGGLLFGSACQEIWVLWSRQWRVGPRGAGPFVGSHHMADIARGICIVWASLIYLLLTFEFEVRIWFWFLGHLCIFFWRFILYVLIWGVLFFVVEGDSDSFLYQYSCGSYIVAPESYHYYGLNCELWFGRKKQTYWLCLCWYLEWCGVVALDWKFIFVYECRSC